MATLTRTTRAHQRNSKLLWTTVGLGSAVSIVVVGNTPAGPILQEVAQDVGHSSAVAAALLSTAAREVWDTARRGGVSNAHWASALAGSVEQLAHDTSKRTCLAAMGNGVLLDWILKLAVLDDVPAARNALMLMLEDGTTCPMVFARPRAVPMLLLAAAASTPQAADLRSALWKYAGSACTSGEVLVADMQSTILQLIDKDASLATRLLASKFLAAWLDVPRKGSASAANAAEANHAKAMGLGLPQALAAAQTFAGSCAEGPNMELASLLLTIMKALALGSSSMASRRGSGAGAEEGAEDAYHLASCVKPAMFIAADALASKDATQVCEALDTLSLVLRRGGSPAAAQVAASSFPHLLWSIAKWAAPVSKAAGGQAAGAGHGQGQGAGGSGKADASNSNSNSSAWSVTQLLKLGKSAPTASRQTQAQDGSQSNGKDVAQGDSSPQASLGGFDEAPAVVRAVAGVVGALVGRDILPDSTLPRWRDWALACLVTDDPSAPSSLPSPSQPSHPGRPHSSSASSDASASSKQWVDMQESLIDALSALSGASGNIGLQAAHYWLSRLLAALAGRTLPYTSLVYAEGHGPKDPEALLDAVPVLPSYVKTVCSALERAADAVAADTPDLPLEFDLQGVTPIQRPALLAAYRHASQVVDLVMAEKCAADALEALGAIVAGDRSKLCWLVDRGVLPLMARLTAGLSPQSQGQAQGSGDSRPAAGAGQEAQPDLGGEDPSGAFGYGEERDPAYAAAEAAAAAASSSGSGSSSADVLASALKASAAAASHATRNRGTAPLGPAGHIPPVVADFETGEAVELWSDHEGGPALCLQRQLARMAALMAALPPHLTPPALLVPPRRISTNSGSSSSSSIPAARHQYFHHNTRHQSQRPSHVREAQPFHQPYGFSWQGWLSRAAHASDCRLSSHAMRALLNLEAQRTNHRQGPGAAPILLDGVHLLSPLAPHHWALSLGKGPPSGVVRDGQSRDTASSQVDVSASPDGHESAPASASVLLARTRRDAGEGSTSTTSSTSTNSSTDMSSGSSSQVPGYADDDDDRPRGVPGLGDITAKVQAGLSQAGLRLRAAVSRGIDSMLATDRTDTGFERSSSHHAAGTPGPTLTPTPGAGHGRLGVKQQQQQQQQQPAMSSCSSDAKPASLHAAAGYECNPSAGCVEPDVDVVFLHGIRGGPFITWRRPEVVTRGSAAHMSWDACWPSTWLAQDMGPSARLLSVEYLAPVSGWEGESLPLEDNVVQVMDKLAAAGVGSRPVVFVAHSMGGLLAKEMLAAAAAQGPDGPHKDLLKAVRGVIFYGTPHFGSSLAAMGWKLRHVPGAHPAPSLARLTPGPHLLELNDNIQRLYEAADGRLTIACFMEGAPTQLTGVLPKISIVPPESAFCGFGEAMLLPDADHINVCKPASQASPAYTLLLQLLRGIAVERNTAAIAMTDCTGAKQ